MAGSPLVRGKTADTVEVTTAWKPGERAAVFVEATDGGRRAVDAILKRQAENVCELTLEAPLRDGHEHAIVVSIGAGCAQRFAPVLRSQLDGRVLTIWTRGNWQAASDRRSHPRFPTMQHCSIAAGGVSAPARCVDISRTGAAVETAVWRPQEFDLVVAPDGAKIVLPCRQVGIESFLGTLVIHASFRDVPVEARPVLEAWVARAKSEFREAQRFLSGRVNDGVTALPIR